MACGRCGTTSKKPSSYVYTSGDGKVKVFGSEAEAKAQVNRTGGSYKPQ